MDVHLAIQLHLAAGAQRHSISSRELLIYPCLVKLRVYSNSTNDSEFYYVPYRVTAGL